MYGYEYDETKESRLDEGDERVDDGRWTLYLGGCSGVDSSLSGRLRALAGYLFVKVTFCLERLSPVFPCESGTMRIFERA